MARNFYPMLIAIALLLALLLRFWGIDYGMPQTQVRPDESLVVEQAWRMLYTGDWNPKFFKHPEFHARLLALVYAAAGYAATWTPHFDSIEDWLASLWTHPTPFYVLARALSALPGAATVLAIAVASKNLAGRRASVIAAFLWAVCYLAVRDDHFAKSDSMQAFFIAAAVAVLSLPTPRLSAQAWTLAAVFTGLAAASKYVGGMVILAGIARAFLENTGAGWRMGLRQGFRSRGLYLYLAFSALAYFLACPHTIFDFPAFAHELFTQFSYHQEGYRAFAGRGWRFHPTFSLPIGLGMPLLILAFLGIAAAWRRSKRQTFLVLLVFPAAYAGPLLYTACNFVRYALPLAPFAAAFAGGGIAALAERFSTPRRRLAVALILTALAAAPNFHRSILFNRIITQQDTRGLAAQWITEQIPADGYVLQPHTFLATRVHLPPSRSQLLWERQQASGLDEDIATMRLGALPAQHKGFRFPRFAEDLHTIEWGGRTLEEKPHCVIVYESPLHLYSPADWARRELALLLREGYELSARITGYDPDRPARYDSEDALFIPFAKMGRIQRPGPNFRLYTRVNQDADSSPSPASKIQPSQAS